MLKHLYIFTTLSLLVFSVNSFASPGDGHNIEIRINGHELDTIYLGYHLGSKQYIRDTIAIDKKKNAFIAQGDKPLEGGIYMIILPPENKYLEVFIGGPEDQKFSVETDVTDLVGKASFKGSEGNSRFFEYLKYIGDNKKELELLKSKEKTETDKAELQKLHDSMDELNSGVTQYQQNIIQNNPGSLLSAIVKLTLPPDIPDPEVEMTEEQESEWRFNYYKKHFFDPVDFSDRRLLRTPIYESKIEQYVNNMTVRHPDSIVIAIDRILDKASADEEVFKFSLMHFLNKYAKSKIVGMDAVYVHLVDKYYSTGKAPG